MGTQTEIAKTIVEEGAEYVLGKYLNLRDNLLISNNMSPLQGSKLILFITPGYAPEPLS